MLTQIDLTILLPVAYPIWLLLEPKPLFFCIGYCQLRLLWPLSSAILSVVYLCLDLTILQSLPAVPSPHHSILVPTHPLVGRSWRSGPGSKMQWNPTLPSGSLVKTSWCLDSAPQVGPYQPPLCGVVTITINHALQTNRLTCAMATLSCQ